MSEPRAHIISKVKDWPIYKLDQNRNTFVKEVGEVVFKQLMTSHGKDIEALLEKTVYLEKIRVRTNPWKVDPPDEAKYWKTIGKEIKKASLAEDKEHFNKELLKRVINRYTEEITGGFKEKTYRFSIGFLTRVYRKLLNTFSGKENRWFWGSKKDYYDKFHIRGYDEETRTLFKKGTIVVVPTHFSNLDSIMIGYILDRIVGLPSFAYAAGLNLFDSEILAFFMNRLGAYRVDRRKKNPIYLECLKSVTNQSLQNGVNNIFFPGGTRSREGAIESKLKLGLLGSVVEAQRAIYQKGGDNKIFIVPIVVGYPFVLEAKSLITQHLRKTGREKYIHSRDKLSKTKKTYRFIKHALGRGSEIYMSLAEPMDALGNRVDVDGNSLDERGNIIDLKNYFTSKEGDIEHNSQRENVYTRVLGDKIVDSYLRNNEVISPHLIAYLCFEYLVRLYPDFNLYNIINLKPKSIVIPLDEIKQIVEQAVKYLLSLSNDNKILLSDEILMPAEQIVRLGVKKLGVFHPEKTLYMDKHGNIKTEDLKLLYYYHNRMNGYQLDEKINWNIKKVEI